MLFNLARAAAIAAALLVAVPALASGAKEIQVSYADLNLSTASGKAELERRVTRAADRACNVPVGRHHVKEQVLAKQCASAARESAGQAIELAYRNAAGRQLAARDMSVTVAP